MPDGDANWAAPRRAPLHGRMLSARAAEGAAAAEPLPDWEVMARFLLEKPQRVSLYVGDLMPQAWWSLAPREEVRVPWYLPDSEEVKALLLLRALSAAISQSHLCCIEGLRSHLHLQLVERLACGFQGRSRREELQALECLTALSSWSGPTIKVILEARALVPYVSFRLEAIAAVAMPSMVDQEVMLLELLCNLSSCEDGRRAIVSTQLPVVLTRYCCLGNTALATRAMEVIRTLAGDEALTSEWSLVHSLLALAMGGAVEERLSAVRALQILNEQGKLHGLGKDGDRLVIALEMALQQGRIPQLPSANDEQPPDEMAAEKGTCDEVRMVTALLGALRVCRLEEQNAENREMSSWRQA